MGYDRTWSDRCANVLDVIDATGTLDLKMEDSTTATAPTLVTGGIHHDEDDTTTIRSLDSVTGRGILSTLEDDEEDHHPDAVLNGHPYHGMHQVETCSVSTGTTDEASSIGGTSYAGDASRLKHQFQQHHHRRVPSWETSPHHQHTERSSGPSGFNLPPSYSPSGGWSSVAHQQHVASFRGDGYRSNPHSPPRYGASNTGGHEVPFLPPTFRGETRQYQRQANTGNYGYYAPTGPAPRKNFAQPPLPPSSTPPRNKTTTSGRMIPTGQSPHRPQAPTPGSSTRSSSEILKTLLRKKACLYEPDTSRAVALVTWLVGRELALSFGFFSRQQLQAGVHACVSHMIDSGTITRTKVNRCMQIILNSCFHYIIPRPDGSEENGESFRAMFAKEMKDELSLLSVLPPPWNTIRVESRLIATASMVDHHDHHAKTAKKTPFETPQASPRLGSIQDKGSPGKESTDGDGSEAKRAVLLCFNENVRCAEDVFRCHNEFIRDTAHACNLQLSSNEWRQFFGREAAGAKHLWGNIGIPVPYLEGQGPGRTDALGVLTKEELSKLRTSWCCKRYEHDHELCGFAHAEINGGWLRRDPTKYHYKPEMCPYVKTIRATWSDNPNDVVVLNECPKGVDCEFAHSAEEIAFHPLVYKKQNCSSVGRSGGCHLGDLCPHHHPADSYRFPKKNERGSPRHGRSPQALSSQKATTSPNPAPHGSPILYAGASPQSRFEDHLLMPGLQELYRRHCAVIKDDLLKNQTGAPRGEHYQQGGNHAIVRDRNVIGPPQPLRV